LELSLKAMKCKAVLKEIEELEASAGVSAPTETHLLACASCRAFAQERAALRLLVGSLEKVSAPDDFNWRLRARLAEAGSEREPARRWFAGFAPSAQAITVAASFTLLLVAVVIYRQATHTPANETPVATTGINESVKPPTAGNPSVPVIPQPSVLPNISGNNTKPRANDEVRQRVAKSAKANDTRTENAGVASTPKQTIFSTDFGSRGAEDLAATGLRNSFTNAGPVISVRVPSPKSAQLRFEDGQGTRRTLSSVNFGGQELTERPDKARIVPASEKGIW
jgi:hypothetical protein